MTTVLFVRHGRTTANTGGILAGWADDVALDDTGHAQARDLALRLAELSLDTIVTSPLQRCLETTAPLRQARPQATLHLDERLGEVRYGEWQGRELKKLARDPLWKAVQAHPSAVTFPGPDGEPMREMQVRAVSAVREWNERLGAEAVYIVVSHGDVIKALLADALGMHLDQFQRIVVDPASVSVVDYTPLRPFVLRVNSAGADLGNLGLGKRRRTGGRARRSKGSASSDAAVGGRAGSSA